MSRSAVVAFGDNPLSLALRRRVGNGRPLNVDQVAHAIGIKRRTFEGWLYGESTPRCLDDLKALIRFFDAGFANEIMADTGKVVVDQAVLDAAPKAQEALQSLNDLATLLKGRA